MVSNSPYFVSLSVDYVIYMRYGHWECIITTKTAILIASLVDYVLLRYEHGKDLYINLLYIIPYAA